jgi:hypothetical protein
VSMLDGPPCMKRKITRLAFAGKCGFLSASAPGASGIARSRLSASKPASPSVPNPQAACRSIARRESGCVAFQWLKSIKGSSKWSVQWLYIFVPLDKGDAALFLRQGVLTHYSKPQTPLKSPLVQGGR